MRLTNLALVKPESSPGSYFQTQASAMASRLPKFGNGAITKNPLKARKVLETVDFIGKGVSPASQIALIFGSLITWRLLAANDRRRASVSKRWNELRENLMRDLLGFGFWFLGVPVVQRVYLRTVAKHNPRLQDVLVQKEAESQNKVPEKRWMEWLKSNNPVNNRYIPSRQQVVDQKKLALEALGNIDKKSELYKQTEAAYENLIKHRNYATAIGLGSTILLLGIGINLLNFYLTHKNMNRNQQSNQPLTPPVSSQPPRSALEMSMGMSMGMSMPFYPGSASALQNPFLTQTHTMPAQPVRRTF